MVQRFSARDSRWVPAILVRMVLVLVAAWAAPLAVPAAASADSVDKVTVGAYINDLQDIDLASENFTADFYLWMRWKNPKIDPSATIESMNSEATQNTTSSSTGGVAGEPLYDAPLDMLGLPPFGGHPDPLGTAWQERMHSWVPRERVTPRSSVPRLPAW